MSTSRTLFSLFILSLALGAGLQAVSGAGTFLPGWFACTVLLYLCSLGIYFAWRGFGGGKALAWMVILAFGLRLGLGMALSKAMPVFGYDQPEQRAGYLSKDAFNRDTQAWQLAASNHALLEAFSSEYPSDQYGGMLALSAAVYRGLSPDAHRATLILILAAGAAAIGIAFAYGAICERWDAKIARLAAWILVLYPESVFWGASQMREPFLIGLIGIAFWAIFAYPRWKVAAVITLAASLLGLFLISNVVALSAAAALAVLAWLEYLPERGPAWPRIAGWVVVGVGAVMLVLVTGAWLRTSANYDISLAEKSSGWVQLLVQKLGSVWRVPLVVVYGITRPLLPAALLETSAWLPKLLSVWRSVGWYALLPFLVFSGLAAWRVPDARNRRLLIWLAVFSWLWILISSARGGGDASDNPRYRVIFILFMALLASWAFYWAKEQKNAWLVRITAMEGVFLAAFMIWYAGRYMHGFPVPPILAVVGFTVGAIILISVAGIWQDGRQRLAVRGR